MSLFKIDLDLFKVYKTHQGKDVRVLYSLNNFMMPLGSHNNRDITVNTFYLAKAKEDLTADVKRAAKYIKPVEDYPVHIILTVYRGSNRQTDMGNYHFIEKFATDALVKAGIFKEDNWKYIQSVTTIDGGLDKKNPRLTYEVVDDL